MRRTVGTEIKNQILHQNAKKTNKQKKTLKMKVRFWCLQSATTMKEYILSCLYLWMNNAELLSWALIANRTIPGHCVFLSGRCVNSISVLKSYDGWRDCVCMCVCMCVYVCVVFSMMKALTALLETLLHVCPAILPSGASVIIYGKCRLFFQVALYRFVLYIHK